MAIGRYVARKHGLAGRDDLESAMCDMIVDGAQDMLPKMRPIVIALMAHDADKLVSLGGSVGSELISNLEMAGSQFQLHFSSAPKWT